MIALAAIGERVAAEIQARLVCDAPTFSGTMREMIREPECRNSQTKPSSSTVTSMK
jgi:hypothetical protein